MKGLRRFLYLLSAVVILCSAALLVADLYTKDKIDKLCDGLVGSYSYSYGNIKSPSSVPGPLYLGEVLYSNIYAHAKEGERISAGPYTPEHYKSGFRDMLAKNPKLAYEAWDLYKDYFFEQFNNKMDALNAKATQKAQDMKYGVDTSHYMSRYKYVEDENGSSKRITRDAPVAIYTYKHYVKDGEMRTVKDGEHSHIYYPLGSLRDSLANYDTKRYWKQQKVVMQQYQKLSLALSKLDEKTLQEYMTEIDAQFSNYGRKDDYGKVHTWLVKEGLMPEKPEDGYEWTGDAIKDGSWNYWVYPIDLLFLAVRIHKDYPSLWPYKRFFKEVNTFSGHVIKDLP